MATIVLSAVGASLGASIGGGVLGLSSAVIGRAVGATLGRVIDQRLMGSGSEIVDTGRVDRFRLMGASEGAPLAQVYGRMRVSGQVIWSSRFSERVSTSGRGSGKGSAPSAPKTRNYSYSVSLAVALCEGEITSVGRIWADGIEVSADEVSVRVHHGTEWQLPDPKIEAVEGAGKAPAYRGIAYVLIEDLALDRFGNRVPQFNFEVTRPEPRSSDVREQEIARGVTAVALMPGTGEYALATTPVYLEGTDGTQRAANINSASGRTDFTTSFKALCEELPACEAVSLVVSWFGDDLRCGSCGVRPKVENKAGEAERMPWRVSGLTRGAAQVVPRIDNRPIYGGTPTDESVVEAIKAMRSANKAVMFYPFLLMDQLPGNALRDPWTGGASQPGLPWRGRMTLSDAPGRAGSPDGTAIAREQVAAFFGTTRGSDFTVQEAMVSGLPTAQWDYRRFVLHYAHLCKAAGGVDAFCVGSEMRGLTQIRDGEGSYPAVAELQRLVRDVRAILGPGTKLSYAADWSEYFGHQPQDGSGDVHFHLDRLWADPDVDFVGIDNYMPLSDWRGGETHADAAFGSVYNLDYLRGNVAGGEGYDWYYPSVDHADSQDREPIADGMYGEHWVFRYKDIRNWWTNRHYDRPGGVRVSTPTDWLPGMKPVWFTEYGCAAVDNATNEPNKFLDPKSSESSLPKYSSGRRDDLIQMQYLRAVREFWSDAANNPVSSIYGGPMVDTSRTFVWAWDARPFPQFPSNRGLWSDGGNYSRGHWLNGRSSSRSLASVVKEICKRSGVDDVDVSQLHGYVRGYSHPNSGGAREALQSLMLVHGFDAIEREGRLAFRSRSGRVDMVLEMDRLAVVRELPGDTELTRAPDAEIAGRVRLTYFEAEGDFDLRGSEALLPGDRGVGVAQSELSMLLTSGEGMSVAERWLCESRIARDSLRFGLPLSEMGLQAGDVVASPSGRYRIDRIEQDGMLLLEATRTEGAVYEAIAVSEDPPPVRPFVTAVPVAPVFLDLPLLTDSQVPHSPYVAIGARPWQGPVALYRSDAIDGYALNTVVEAPATLGVLEDPLTRASSDRWDLGQDLRVRLKSGTTTLASVSTESLLNGANLAAIGDGTAANWEVIQFADANLVAEDTYVLRRRLRGLVGTDAVIPDIWPPGSRFVLLDGTLTQVELGLSLLGLERTYRIGLAQRGYDDPSYVQRSESFGGIGLRPYSPVHLRADRDSVGDLHLSWIRRTRIAGDSWNSYEVPLGETFELYTIEIRKNGQILRKLTVPSANSWTYHLAAQQADGAIAPFAIEVAQISETYGPGPYARIAIDV